MKPTPSFVLHQAGFIKQKDSPLFLNLQSFQVVLIVKKMTSSSFLVQFQQYYSVYCLLHQCIHLFLLYCAHKTYQDIYIGLTVSHHQSFFTILITLI